MPRIVSVSDQVRHLTPPQPSPEAAARSKRVTRGGVNSGTRVGDGWRRSADDERLLEVATKLGALTIRQAHRHIYKASYQTARKRIARMVQAGLLARDDTSPWAGPIVYPTAAGRTVAVGTESALRAMEPPAATTMFHRLAVGEIALGLLADGHVLITEREIRLHQDRSGQVLYDFLESKGVKRGGQNIPGVIPTVRQGSDGPVEHWLTLPMSGGDATQRIPDLLRVTPNGELAAIEVEVATKGRDRLGHIINAYRDCCTGHNTVPRGSGHSLKTAGRLRRQFTNVQWICSSPVAAQLRGPENGINALSGKTDNGLVRTIWDADLATHLFFEHESTWRINKPGWPIQVTDLDLAADPGMEYMLCQQVLPPTFRTSMRNWRIWHQLWASEVSGDENPVAFERWLRTPGVLPRCTQLTRGH